MTEALHTPPLGIHALTPFYDRAIAVMTRETVWRSRLVEHIGAKPNEMILDVGSGTGSLAVAVTDAAPDCIYRGIDPDAGAVEIARQKVRLAGSTATFQLGSLDEQPPHRGQVDKVVCSLVLHQVPLDEKRRLLGAMFHWLKPGGQIFIADYGSQPTLTMRLAFRLTVQLLDGTSDTQSNADGVLPVLIEKAGFQKLSTIEAIDTATGRIEIVRAEKPGLGG